MKRIVLLALLIACTGCKGTDIQKTHSGHGTPDGRHTQWTPAVWTEYLAAGPKGNRLPDFSRAGYAMGSRPIPDVPSSILTVTDAPFGARPDDGADDTAAIQAAIDAAGAAGGGVVLLPKGRYDIHTTTNGPLLRIRRSNIILRGLGSGPDGTILHLGAPAPAGKVRRLGSVPAGQEARHGAAIAVMGAEERTELARYATDLPRGNRIVTVSSTDRLTPGRRVIIEFTDPRIDCRRPSPEKADLAARLTAPFALGPAQIDTVGCRGKHHAWGVTIEAIIDPVTIRLTRPARFDQFKRYQPKIYSFQGVRQVGIEHLRIESAWPGQFRHHKPHAAPDGTIIRTAQEQDYLWNGIWISSAADGWVRDVVFKDLTQGIIVSRSANLTLQDLAFHGKNGHAGITIAHSNDLLVSKVDFHARLVHPITLTMMASGNVITQCTTHYQGRDDRTATDAVIDFHGFFPYENLLENLDGFYICPGGDLSVMPHAGIRNVFWNITAPAQMSCYTCNEDNDFVRTYDTAATSSGTAATMFEHFPQSFYIGITRQGQRPVTIAGSTNDRRNPWMTVEGLNRPDNRIASLYQAQRQHPAEP